MIQLEVQEVAGIYRGELRWMFGPYPALIPDLSWPSVGILDALCAGLRYRDHWTEGEELFLAGAAAHLAELVHECWVRLAGEVRVEHDEEVVCVARGSDGASYRLPLERSLRRVLREDVAVFPALEGDPSLAPGIADAKGPATDAHRLELFGLAACLGISPLGTGPWGSPPAGELRERIAALVPYLAETTALRYAQLYPGEPLGGRADLYKRMLIWPPAGLDGGDARGATTGLLAYLDRQSIGLADALPLLANLARFPSATVRSAALGCLALDERVSLSGELVEVARDHFAPAAAAHRAAAIDLAWERGRNVDWLRGGASAPARFRFERRLALLPLVHMPYDMCVDPSNAELVTALVEMDGDTAARLLERREDADRAGRYLFQRAMLERWADEPEAADELFAEIVRNHPSEADGDVFLEAGLNALELGRFEDAITRLQRAWDLGRGGFRVALGLGRAYAEAGRHAEAVTMFSDAVARGHLPSAALIGRAEQRRAMGLEEGYFRDLAAAAALHPFNPEVVGRVMEYYIAK